MACVSRRVLIGGAAAMMFVERGRAGAPGRIATADAALADLARRSGGRLGVAAIDTGSGARIGLAGHERFAMCSTFKVVLAAAILARVDRGARRLEEAVAFGPADLLDHAPVVRAHLAEGRLPIGALCAATIGQSDNSAANLLLPLVGGPAGLTRFMRAAGDRVTRLDRGEPALNENIPGDARDTTTPAAMLGLMRRLLLGRVLTPGSRTRLIGWMDAATTGTTALRAGLPSTWRVGDKTGMGERGATNDIAIARPPGRAPILIVAYASGSPQPVEARKATLAAVGKIVAAAFA